MTEADPLLRWGRVERWIEYAEVDVRIAAACMNMNPPTRGGAAYHCQQAAEKLLKGFLVQAGIDFRRTHDLSELGDLVLSQFPFVEGMVRAIEDCTVWGVAYRYPGDNVPDPEPETDTLVKALAVIGALRQELGNLAPRGDGDT